jgi:hypothetical protein
VSKLGRAGLALVLVTVLVPLAGVAAGASVSAKQKPVSEAKYARSVCSAYTNLIQEIEDYTTSYKATSNEPVQFQTEVVALTNDLVAKITLDQAKVKKVYPDVDDGKKIAKLFANNLAEIKSEISGALAKFQAADANGVAFQADVAQFEVAINLLSVKTSDPFSKVTDQDVIGAFDDEKACKTVVNVYGG